MEFIYQLRHFNISIFPINFLLRLKRGWRDGKMTLISGNGEKKTCQGNSRKVLIKAGRKNRVLKEKSIKLFASNRSRKVVKD